MRFALIAGVVVALMATFLWLVMPTPNTQDLTRAEQTAIEQYLTEQVQSEFGDLVVTTQAGECSDFFDLCFASTTVAPHRFAAFARNAFDTGFELEEANCQPVGCDAVWRSDNATVAIVTFPEEFPGDVADDEPLMMVRITPRS